MLVSEREWRLDLAGTFASLLLTGIQLLEEIGLAVALGVLLAANVLATRIVPTLAAMGPFHFWWPRKTDRRTRVKEDDLGSPEASSHLGVEVAGPAPAK
jgi:hypothetical protein